MNKGKNNKSNFPITTTLDSSEALSIIQEILEIGLDQYISDPILQEIPVVKWIFNLRKTVISVRDYFLIKKILKFINDLDKISTDDRKSFINRIEQQIGEKEFGEYILMVLDRYDHIEKATFLSKIFYAYVMNEISTDEFFRISSSIDKAYLEDLHNLLDYYSSDIKNKRSIYDKTKRNLFSANFSDFYVLTQDEQYSGGLEHPQIYHFNPLAKSFAKIILKNKFRQQ